MLDDKILKEREKFNCGNCLYCDDVGVEDVYCKRRPKVESKRRSFWCGEHPGIQHMAFELSSVELSIDVGTNSIQEAVDFLLKKDDPETGGG